MILDTLTLLSDDQDLSQVAGTYYSDILNTLGDAGYSTSSDAPSGVGKAIGEGTPVPLLCQVTQTFTTGGGAATLVVTLQSSVDEAFTSPINEITSKTFALAELVQGAFLLPQHLPYGTKQYLRIRYVIATATTTAGTVTAGVGTAIQSNR